MLSFPYSDSFCAAKLFNLQVRRTAVVVEVRRLAHDHVEHVFRMLTTRIRFYAPLLHVSRSESRVLHQWSSNPNDYLMFYNPRILTEDGPDINIRNPCNCGHSQLCNSINPQLLNVSTPIGLGVVPICQGCERSKAFVTLRVGHLLSPEVMSPHVSPWRVGPNIVVSHLCRWNKSINANFSRSS